MNPITKYIKSHHQKPKHIRMVPRLECKDGFSMSVQAGWHAYCTPRDDDGPWTQFEVGYPRPADSDLMEYAEDADSPTETVYGYVPSDVILGVIAKHGGCEALE